MSAWYFETGGVPTCGKTAGAFYKVELATQDVAPATWGTGLTEADFSTGAVELTPFTNVSGTEWNGNFDAGNIGVASQTYECHNYVLEAGGTRIWDILESINKDTTDLHIRISRKETSGGTYAIKFWGVVNWQSLEVAYGDFDDEDTWLIRFSVDDTITQLERRSVEQFYDEQLLHVDYDYIGTNVYIDFIGADTPNGVSTSLIKGAYQPTGYLYPLPSTEDVNDPTHEVYAPGELRFMRVVELFDAASEYLGLTADVNDGANWNTVHKWIFGYNYAAPGDTETMGWGGIENLLFFAGCFKAASYRQGGTMLERGNDTSVQRAAEPYIASGTLLEMLKRVCISFGATLSIRVNSSGERYLSVVELANIVYTATYGNNAIIAKDAQLRPYARGIDGIQVNSPVGTDELGIRGITGTNSVNVDCLYTSANYLRQTWRMLKTRWKNGLSAIGVEMEPAFMHSLFMSLDSPTGTRSSTAGTGLTYATIYSVSAIVPKQDGTAAPSGAYIQDSLGTYQSSAPFALNAVMYPSEAFPYNTLMELPAIALAHYLYSPQVSNDIGIYRKRGKELTFTQNGVLQAIIYPGSTLTITVGSSTDVWRVVRTAENYKDDLTTITCELYT